MKLGNLARVRDKANDRCVVAHPLNGVVGRTHAVAHGKDLVICGTQPRFPRGMWMPGQALPYQNLIKRKQIHGAIGQLREAVEELERRTRRSDDVAHAADGLAVGAEHHQPRESGRIDPVHRCHVMKGREWCRGEPVSPPPDVPVGSR